MPIATLLQKAYGDFRAEAMESLLKSMCKGLEVQVKVRGSTVQGWVQVEVDGEDEAVALQLFSNEFGLAPTNIASVERFSVLCGKIVDSRRAADELLVDVGVFEPRVVHAKIRLQSLQAQLADGQNIPLQRLAQLFCLYDCVPLYVKILDADFNAQNGTFLAELSERQLALYTDWLRSMLDRLLILGATQRDVKHAVDASKHFRDVVRIESLGWLEHAVVCKLGTDAVGLIPAIGRMLRTATLTSFSPRKIQEIIDRPVL
jgi:hypothetical protein